MNITDFTYVRELLVPGETPKKYNYFSLDSYASIFGVSLPRLPYFQRVLLENLLRQCGIGHLSYSVIKEFLAPPSEGREISIPWTPARIIMQDFSGLPALVDLAALRESSLELGLDPSQIAPSVPVHLVIDHSHQADFHGDSDAFKRNLEQEYRVNRERYVFFKWAGSQFKSLTISPPGSGIIHQINLEQLTPVTVTLESDGIWWAFPDSLLGMDSHTTMINGVGTVGWGVGGLEAEAVMLGEKAWFKKPRTVGVRLTGRRPSGVTASDLALALTQHLRGANVVENFVEFFGPALDEMSVPDRAVVANMAPEYGATMGYFPVDRQTLDYLRLTGRERLTPLVEAYSRAQHLFRENNNETPPDFHRIIEFDLSRLQRSVSGPSRPWERKQPSELKEPGAAAQPGVDHRCIALAAITSCTNTANYELLAGAGLLAQAAASRGLKVPSYVKTSFAPGSRASLRFLQQANLMSGLEALGFHHVGFGCSTCLGAGGPLIPEMEEAIRSRNLSVCAVLSGNRNFEARIHPLIRENYLASPALTVAYAIAGRMGIDFDREPLGGDPTGNPVYLSDVWPSDDEIRRFVREFAVPGLFQDSQKWDDEVEKPWRDLPYISSSTYPWSQSSTYFRRPPAPNPPGPDEALLPGIINARALAVLGDSVTTDHISPVGAIPTDYPAGLYLASHGVAETDFNTYGARRGNHEIMIRGAFAHIRLANLLTAPHTGGITLKLPEMKEMYIYDAAQAYQHEQTPMIILAGNHYGTGSARDWAARGVALLGVRAVIARSFERIHRGNLIQMGVLPLQFMENESIESLELTGMETFSIPSPDHMGADGLLTATVQTADGSIRRFNVRARLDTTTEMAIYRSGGFLSAFLKKLQSKGK